MKPANKSAEQPVKFSERAKEERKAPAYREGVQGRTPLELQCLGFISAKMERTTQVAGSCCAGLLAMAELRSKEKKNSLFPQIEFSQMSRIRLLVYCKALTLVPFC